MHISEEYLWENEIKQQVLLFEHKVYKSIPNTKNSYREDPINTTTLTMKHAHVYAKPKGGGNELYSVNIDGSGHDGSRDTKIPDTHADFFRGKGYKINANNILECFSIDSFNKEEFSLIILADR